VVLGTFLGLLGGAAGGLVGWWLFFLIVRQGFYAIALPGALLGLGCGCLSGRKSNVLAGICGVAGLVLGLLAEWRFAPFIKDRSLLFFLKHLHELSVVTHVLILLGAALAFWFGRGREGGAWPRRQDPPASQAGNAE
jgi:multisubunit Na+/H+ antiporter MnhB subunit